MKHYNYHFSRAFMAWYKDYLEKAHLTREMIFGDKKNTWDVMRGEEVTFFNVNTLYAAFKAGQESKEIKK